MTTYEYTTLEAARNALNDAIKDVTGDNPDVNEDDIAHDMVTSLASFDCEADVAAELCRTELGWLPGSVAQTRPDVAAAWKKATMR